MIITQDVVQVGVPAMSAYEHLVRFDDIPRFVSGFLSMTPVRTSAAHLELDIGGRRVVVDAMVGTRDPGRFVRWDSATLVESFWLKELPGRQTRVRAVLELDEVREPLHQPRPEAVLLTKLRMDLKGFKRLCEETGPGQGRRADGRSGYR